MCPSCGTEILPGLSVSTLQSQVLVSWGRGIRFWDILSIRNEKRVQSIEKMNIWGSETKKEEKRKGQVEK